MHSLNASAPPARASALPRFAAGLLVAFALLSAACSETGFDINSPSLLSRSNQGSSDPGSGFAVLANAAVTCTDGTITGNVGTFLATPTGSVTQTGCSIAGTVHVGDAAATQAYENFLATYAALAPAAGDVCTVLTGTLAGMTLAPGAYCFTAAATLTGVLTLDGPATGSWEFRIGTGGTGALTGTSFSVVMASGAQACNVTWWVAEAATMTTSDFKGHILAGAAITTTGGTFLGNAWSKADVTITGTALTGCGAAGPPSCKPSGDRVTGGGWIKGSHDGKMQFSVSGGVRRGQFQGHLVFQDEGRRKRNDEVKVRSTGVTAYVAVNARTRRIEGTARINGQDGFTYQVTVTDNRRRGRNDTFSLSLSNGYTASGKVKGGSIQLHQSKDGSCKDDSDNDRDHDRDQYDDRDHDRGHNDDGDDDRKNGRNGNH